MTRWRLLALSALMMALGGCQEPTEIVPVGPPGTQLTRVPPPEKEEPQALGEQSTRASTESPAIEAEPVEAAPPTPIGEPKKTESGVTYETLKEGDGPEAKPGQTVTVHYTGTFEDGTKFDSSRDRGEPFSFSLGQGQVIKGWDRGVAGMKVGERRKLTVPPELGYGAQGQPPTIPPNATLVFDVELLGVK